MTKLGVYANKDSGGIGSGGRSRIRHEGVWQAAPQLNAVGTTTSQPRDIQLYENK